jgi:hypothetical protein
MIPQCDQQYDYKMPWKAIFGLAFLAVFCVLCSIYFALSGRGLFIKGIHLPPEIAAGVWWSLCVLCVGVFFFAVYSGVFRLVYRRRIVLSATSIIVPKSRWSCDEIAIPYDSIVGVWEIRTCFHRFLHIAHSTGEVVIAATFLPRISDYTTIFNMIAQRAKINGHGIE